jgi:hypothetical protein
MKNTRLLPLYEGSDYNIYVPNIDFFLEKIINQEFFSYSKLSVEWWMLQKRAWNTTLNTPAGQRFLKKGPSDIFFHKLAKNMAKEWEVQKGRRKWKSDIPAISRILKMSFEEKPEGFYLGITDRCGVRDRYFPMPMRGKGELPRIFRSTFPKDEIHIHALAFRIWAAYGEIHEFVKGIQDKNVVIVGPKHLNNFGKKLNIKKFNHIKIHSTDAILHVNKTKTQIKNNHKNLLKGNDEVLYCFVGGAAAMWLITELHGELERAFLLDIGRAFDVYYYYDLVKRQVPVWMFGRWLDKAKPTWVRQVLTKNDNGVRVL